MSEERRIKGYNASPLEAFAGLSPMEMHTLIYQPFSEGAPVTWRERVQGKILDQVPFLQLAHALMVFISEAKALKLTKKGNLPAKLVRELYGLNWLPDPMVESGISKLVGEDDWLGIQALKQVLLFSGLVKKRQNHLGLTKRGKTYLAEPSFELLRILFETHQQKFNIAWSDGYPSCPEIQHFTGYTLYLLLRRGGIARPVDYYGQAFLIAFPQLVEAFQPSSFGPAQEEFRQCYSLRSFERFLLFYGLVELSIPERLPRRDQEVEATPVLRALFKL